MPIQSSSCHAHLSICSCICPLPMQFILRPIIGQHWSHDHLPGLPLGTICLYRPTQNFNGCTKLAKIRGICSECTVEFVWVHNRVLLMPNVFFCLFLFVLVLLTAHTERFSVSPFIFYFIFYILQPIWSPVNIEHCYRNVRQFCAQLFCCLVLWCFRELAEGKGPPNFRKVWYH